MVYTEKGIEAGATENAEETNEERERAGSRFSIGVAALWRRRAESNKYEDGVKGEQKGVRCICSLFFFFSLLSLSFVCILILKACLYKYYHILFCLLLVFSFLCGVYGYKYHILNLLSVWNIFVRLYPCRLTLRNTNANPSQNKYIQNISLTYIQIQVSRNLSHLPPFTTICRREK